MECVIAKRKKIQSLQFNAAKHYHQFKLHPYFTVPCLHVEDNWFQRHQRISGPEACTWSEPRIVPAAGPGWYPHLIPVLVTCWWHLGPPCLLGKTPAAQAGPQHRGEPAQSFLFKSTIRILTALIITPWQHPFFSGTCHLQLSPHWQKLWILNLKSWYLILAALPCYTEIYHPFLISSLVSLVGALNPTYSNK